MFNSAGADLLSVDVLNSSGDSDSWTLDSFDFSFELTSDMVAESEICFTLDGVPMEVAPVSEPSSTSTKPNR